MDFFSTRHGKGITRLSPHSYYPSLVCPVPSFVSNRAYLGSFGTASWASHEFERTIGNVTANMEEMSQDIIQNLYASMPDRIASCIRARGSSTGKLTVWCSLWAGGILLQNDEGHNVTVNGDRYRAMITNFFIPELNNHDVQELWFQQDGATCHTARATIDLLKDTFGDRLISRFGPVNWPPRSCDLTPLDYLLWGYVKSLAYADKPQTLDHLEDNIQRVIADIRPQMLEKVIENWTSRLDYIRASRGSPMPEIIFEM
ncbi:uncharacterized protein TNCV_195181 [Trichonephila clavipes]|uniref:Transposable element Tc3 transposase n=1 Tax=Trichonephila clavipes TaxID=2585209 RepID=A0A8X6WIJ1_TRICX|nr:uncharacterized protein TNCV_195181 [Trichonephila clavipes]